MIWRRNGQNRNVKIRYYTVNGRSHDQVSLSKIIIVSMIQIRRSTICTSLRVVRWNIMVNKPFLHAHRKTPPNWQANRSNMVHSPKPGRAAGPGCQGCGTHQTSSPSTGSKCNWGPNKARLTQKVRKKKELRNCGIKSQQTHVHVSKSLCLQFFGDIASDLSWHGHVHASHTEYHAKHVTSPSRPVSKRFEECDVKLADFFDEVFECVCANMFCIPRCSAATIFWSSFACYVAAAVLWRMEFSMSELF